MKRSSSLGALVAPIIAPLVYMAFAAVLFRDPARYDEQTPEAWFSSLLFYIPASYIISFMLGIPLVQILRRFGKLSFWWFSLLAIPLGTIAFILFLVISAFFGATIRWSGMSVFIGVGGIVGFVVAAAYCMLAGITQRSSGTAQKRAVP